MRPRVGESGQTPRRRKTQGNADQDRRKGTRTKTDASGRGMLRFLLVRVPWLRKPQQGRTAPQLIQSTKTGNAHQDSYQSPVTSHQSPVTKWPS
ncbi:MAG: hypothetical protein AAGA60_23540 [Cyanobacteria bacterium P01_E01_bin.42]